MKCPIDVEKYIAAIRLEFGPNEAVEDEHRKIIPFINESYAAGLRGEAGYPIDWRKVAKAFADVHGEPLEIILNNPMLPRLFDWANRAYAQGRRDAEEVNVSKLDTGKEKETNA